MRHPVRCKKIEYPTSCGCIMQIFDLSIDKTNWIEIQSISIIFVQWGISAFSLDY